MGRTGSLIRGNLNIILPLFLALAVLAIAIAYWWSAVNVSTIECEYWSTSCKGRYFPWPSDGGLGTCLMVVTPMDSIDAFVCLLVQYYLYVPLVIIQILVTFWLGRLIAKHAFPPSREEGSAKKTA